MSWGYRIAILTIGFVLFMTFMVVCAFRQNFDLVAEDYYSKELKFQSQMDKQQNQMNLQQPLVCKLVEENVVVEFPKQFEKELIKGSILFFCPSDAKRDITKSINAVSGIQTFSKGLFFRGMYRVQIDYSVAGVNYYQENTLIIP